MGTHNPKRVSMTIMCATYALDIDDFDKEEAIAYDNPEEHGVTYTSQGGVILNVNVNEGDAILTVTLPYTYTERQTLKNIMESSWLGNPVSLELKDDNLHGETEFTADAKFLTGLKKSKVAGPEASTRTFKVYCPSFRTVEDKTIGKLIDKVQAGQTIIE